MKVVWISAGVSSFIAGYIVRESVDKWIYIDIADQHPDSMRFIKDCEKAVGREFEIMRSDKYDDVADVVRKTGLINSPWGASCTGMLKKAVRKKWENEQYRNNVTDITYVWGFDERERRRAERLRENFPEFKHEFPLIDNFMSKQDCHALLAEIGIKRPLMYDMGYSNNNCVGCIKGGKGYFNKIRRDFPEVFEARAKLEREVGHSCINGVYLDELDPAEGRMSTEILEDCSIMCHLVKNKAVSPETRYKRFK